mmetsp:Transcript_11476/g.16730  ORF Transcript_11476/g.16730 Transcript_11476/m.16730 type:complete len:154 (+) Transcript_11476:111-572(+)
MTLALYSTLKRSQPTMDLMSMASSRSGGDLVDADAQCSTKKRTSTSEFGWDHYRSREGMNTGGEHQRWRNEKKSKRGDTAMTSTVRVKTPLHRKFSSVFEEEVEDENIDGSDRVPLEIYLSTIVSGDEEINRNGHNMNGSNHACEITHDLAMI